MKSQQHRLGTAREQLGLQLPATLLEGTELECMLLEDCKFWSHVVDLCDKQWEKTSDNSYCKLGGTGRCRSVAAFGAHVCDRGRGKA